MSQVSNPVITASHSIKTDMTKYKGFPALVILKIKYLTEKDWMRYEIWMKPGWEVAEIWRDAYVLIREEQHYTKYNVNDIEEAVFKEFILI